MAWTSRPTLAAASLGMAALLHTSHGWSLGLMEAYDAARRNDPVYRSAVYEHQGGQEFRVLGRAYLLPNVSASYATSRNNAHINNLPQPDHSYASKSASLQLRQPLVNLEGVARWRQGQRQTEASDAKFESRQQDLILRLFNAYAVATFAEDQIALAAAQRDAIAEQRDANARLFQRGEGTRTEMIEAQAKYDLAEAQLLEARDTQANARVRLAAIVGQEITMLDTLAAGFAVRPPEAGGFDEWRDRARQHNPELMALRLSVAASEQEIRKNQAGHYPRLDLVASHSRNDSDTISTLKQDYRINSVGVQLSVPLFSGGGVSAATRQAAAGYGKAQADLDARTAEVLADLRKQYDLTVSSRLRVDALVQAEQSALLMLDATQKSRLGGLRTNLDVLNAQQQLFTARRDLAQARYNYLIAYLRLRAMAGTLAPEDLQTVAGYFTRVGSD